MCQVRHLAAAARSCDRKDVTGIPACEIQFVDAVIKRERCTPAKHALIGYQADSFVMYRANLTYLATAHSLMHGGVSWLEAQHVADQDGGGRPISDSSKMLARLDCVRERFLYRHREPSFECGLGRRDMSVFRRAHDDAINV